MADDGIHTYFTSVTPDASRRIVDAVRASVDCAEEAAAYHAEHRRLWEKASEIGPLG